MDQPQESTTSQVIPPESPPTTTSTSPNQNESPSPRPNQNPSESPAPKARFQVGSGSTKEPPAGVLRLANPDDLFDDDDSAGSEPQPAPTEPPELREDLEPITIGAPLQQHEVQTVLEAQGRMLHLATRKFTRDAFPEQWLWTEKELEYIVPALTRMANRSRLARRYAKHGDTAIVVIGSIDYVQRNLLEMPGGGETPESDRSDQHHPGDASGDEPREPDTYPTLVEPGSPPSVGPGLS